MRKSHKPAFGSRRKFIGLSLGVAWTSLLRSQNKGQVIPPAVPENAVYLQPKLLREFRNAYLVAVSPDSSKMCLYLTKHPQMIFTIRGSERSYDGGSLRDEALGVIAMGSWAPLYSMQLRDKPQAVSFFARSDILYAQTLPFANGLGNSDEQQLLISVPSGGVEERVAPYNGVLYRALSDRKLLGNQYDQKSRNSQLILATAPDFKEFSRISFAVTQEREPRNRDSGVFVSDDRKICLYGAGHSIVCRRTDDLSIIWTRQIEPRMFGVRSFSMTPDGGIVAAAVMDTMFVADQKDYYVGVFEGRNGTPVARLHLNGNESIAISPDGKLLAVGQRLRLPTGEMQPTVAIHDMASGAQVGTVVHDRLYITGTKDFGNDEIKCQFTPDGKYLVTSSIHTKVWGL
jgi:hypothetical protein